MSNKIKTLYIILLGIIIFSGNTVFADVRPTFENQKIDVLENGTVRFHAIFNSNNNPYFPTNQPITWFIFGDSINDLKHETPKKNRIKGEYIVSQGATLFQEDTTYYVQSLMFFENELTEGEIISFEPYIPDPIVLSDQQITARNIQNQDSTQISNNGQQNNTSYALQPPLNHSFNFSLTSKQETGEVTLTQDKEILEEEKEDNESVSIFKNSATNSQDFDDTIFQTNDTRVDKIGLQGNGLTASAARSGVTTPLLTYLTMFILFVMIAVTTFLWRFTNKKKRRLYYMAQSNNDYDYPHDFRYNEYEYIHAA